MALSDKDIIITPNKSQTADPKIEFRGADSSTGAQTITIKAYPTNGGTLSFEGSSGQLFAVTNSLTGTLFSVNDISGVPSLEVLDTGFVKLAQYGGTVGIGVSTSAYNDKLQIANSDSTGIRFTGSNATITSNYNLLSVASNNIYLRPSSGYSVIIDSGTGLYVSSGNITWAPGSQNNGNPRSLAIGYSGANYGQTGYGITFTGTSGVHNYAISDIVSLWEAYDGIRVLAAAAGTVGQPITWTTVLDARRSNSALTFKGNTVLDSNNYNSYSPTLTGTGASGTWGISINGNATTATTATNWGTYGGVPAAGTSFATANTIGRSDGNGHTYFYYINSNTSNNENGTVSQFIITNGSDNFYRKASLSHVKSQMSLSASDNPQFNSIGLAIAASGTAGSISLNQSGTRSWSITPTGGNLVFASGDGLGSITLSSTSDSSLKIRGGTLYGPNTTWGAYLMVGGDGRQNYIDNTSTASVTTTNGNLHLDAASGSNSYINWYDGNDLLVGTGDSGTTRLRVYGSSNYTEVTGSMRAPVFYDKDDTSYYVDPANGGFSLRGGTSNRVTYTTTDSGIFVANAEGSGTTVRIGAAWNLPGIYNNTSLMLGSENTITFRTQNVERGYMDSGANFYAYGSMRSPVFYDYNDTNFRLDPASTTTSLQIAGAIEQGNNFAHPNVEWAQSGSATGMVIIKLPGSTSNYGMIHAVIDIYEYSSNSACTVTVAGHNWNGAWYNISSEVIGFTDKQVRVGVKDSQYCIVIGTSGSSWSYGQVRLRKIQNGSYYNDQMDLGGTYSASITTTESFSNISGDLRNLRTPAGFTASSITASTISATTSISGNEVYSGNWFRNNNSGTGLYNQTTTQHLSSSSNGFWDMSSTTTDSGIRLYTGGHLSALRGYLYSNTANDVGLLNNSGTWRLRVVGGDYVQMDGSSARGRIFYDLDDSGYYIDANSGSNLNRLNVAGYTMRSSATLDMSNTGVYSTSNYYPVTIPVSAMAGSYAMPVRMRILNSLNSNVPSWSNHGAGFTCHIEWTSNGSGWGTIGINRTIHRYTEGYTNSTICGGITQMTNGSIEVIWLRGGGIYYFEADANVTPTIRSTTYTDNGQSVTPTSAAQNDVWSSATTTMSLGYLKTNNTITVGGTATFNGNVNLGSSNGNITRVNDILRLGASDSGDSEFLFGEDTSGWYGSRWYWDSGYTHYWYSRNAGTDTELMRFVTNDWNSPLYISRSTYITGGTSNNANDATLYVTADNDNDWAMIINKYRSAATNYGLQILVASADNYALGVYGNGNTLNFRVGGDGQVRASGNIFAPGFYNSADTATRFVNGSLVLRSSAPTVYFRDTDNRSAMIHVNSNIFYVLRGNGTDSESWATVNGAWPLELNLENNNASIGGALYVGSTLSSSDIYMGDTDEGQRRIHNNSNRIGFLNDGNGWGSWCADSGYWQSDQSVRSPLFYDSDDTNFYVDPASLGSTASIVRGRFNISGNHNYSSLRVYLPSENNGAATGTVSLQMWCSEPGNTWDGAGFGYNVDNNENNGGAAPAYYFGRVNTSIGQAYMRFLTSGDWYFYNTNTSGTRTLSLTVGSDGIFTAYNQIRTPIIYDSNDTNYYIDPASTSRVNTVSFVSGATFGPYLQYGNVAQNLRLQGGSGSEIGISGYDFNGNWRFQLYGQSGAYGFLNGNWAGWDLQKNTSGNLYLNNQTTYYISTNEIYYNRVYGVADIRSPLFYDNDNTAYYCNPAGTSQFLQLDVVNSIGASDDVRSGTRMYDSAGMAAGVGGQLVLGYKYTTAGAYTEGAILKTYKINATDGNYGSGLKIQVRNHGESLATKVQIDGSGNMVIGGNMTNNSYDSVGSTRLLFGGGNDPNSYFIGTNLNNYGGNYTKLDLRWHTGIRMGARPGYGGIRIFSDETVGTRIASFGETDSHVRIDNNLYVGQIIDISNSTYYVDPASSSRLNGGIQLDGSLGVGTAGSGTAGEIRATNNITAYYSDDRLKTKLGIIENPIEKVKSLSGFYFEANETAVALGYQKKREVGVSAQEVQAILPEIIAPAPIDDKYMTVRYEKLIPLLIEAIKEQQKQIEELKSLLSNNK